MLAWACGQARTAASSAAATNAGAAWLAVTHVLRAGEAATMSQKLLYSSRIKMSAQDSSNPYSYYSHGERLDEREGSKA